MFLNFGKKISIVDSGGRFQEYDMTDVLLQLPDEARIVGHITANQYLVAFRIELEILPGIECIVQKIRLVLEIKTVVQYQLSFFKGNHPDVFFLEINEQRVLFFITLACS
jgi:hypothetical protein